MRRKSARPGRQPRTARWSISVRLTREMWRRTRSGQGRFPRFAVERHCIPIAPHLLCPQYLDEETERWLGLKMGIVFMGKCEEVWVFGDTVSEGMAAEIEKARKLRKKIRYFTDDLREKEGMAG